MFLPIEVDQFSQEQIDAFKARINISETGCWLWTGSRTSWGYGSLKLNGKFYYCHRLSYTLSKGAIPDGLVLDHLCRIPHCVNPEHLEPVTNKENIKRGVGPGHLNSQKQFCYKGHPFSGHNLIIDRRGFRICRICRNDIDRKSQFRRREAARQKAAPAVR